jgi:hypothetical protein
LTKKRDSGDFRTALRTIAVGRRKAFYSSAKILLKFHFVARGFLFLSIHQRSCLWIFGFFSQHPLMRDIERDLIIMIHNETLGKVPALGSEIEGGFVCVLGPGLITGAADHVSRKIYGDHENERSSRKLRQRR